MNQKKAMDFELIQEEQPKQEDQEDAVSIKMREYQEKAILEIERAWAEGEQKLLLVFATGCGKTIVFSKIAKEWMLKTRVLIIAHTDELIEQAIEKLGKLGVSAAKEKGVNHASIVSRVVCASVQTLKNQRLLNWPPEHFGLVIIDEAHRTAANSYVNIINHFQEAKVLGVTATPARGDEKSLRKYYTKLVMDYGIKQAVEDGWLVRPYVQTVPMEIDLRPGPMEPSTRAGDIAAYFVGHRIEPFLEEIAKKVKEYAGDRKTVLFLPTIDTAVAMKDFLVKEGIQTTFVTGKCKDRKEKLDAYANGEYQMIVNAMILTEGWDDDATSCVVCLRPTQITSLYTQMVGRGTRPLSTIVKKLGEEFLPERRRKIIAESAKPNLLLIDFLWLYEKHNIVQPACLVAPNDSIEKRMKRDGDLLENEEDAERELKDALSEALIEANKKKRKASVIDPLALTVATGDVRIADYEAFSNEDEKGVTEAQANILAQNRIDLSRVKNRGHASLIISKIIDRRNQGLCSFGQLSFLKRLGVDATKMTKKEATRRISQRLAEFRKEKQLKLNV